MNMRKVVWMFLLAAFAIGSLITLVNSWNRTRKETSAMNDWPSRRIEFAVQEVYSVEEVQRIAGIEIPDSATEVQVYGVTGWLDDYALIKFKLPAHELGPFLEKHGFHDLEPGYWSIYDSSSVDWWPNRLPDSKKPIEKYLGGKFEGPDRIVQRILVDITNEDFYIIYLQCFET